MSPRQDHRVSAHFHDIENFYREWDINGLPWEAVTPVPVGEKHPDDLDQRLVDALLQGPLSQIPDAQKNARAASLAFLYLYMSLSTGGER